ncbi:hypothetical protein MHYP_G00123480 [Metynnis hypsauchen]
MEATMIRPLGTILLPLALWFPHPQIQVENSMGTFFWICSRPLERLSTAEAGNLQDKGPQRHNRSSLRTTPRHTRSGFIGCWNHQTVEPLSDTWMMVRSDEPRNRQLHAED